MTLKQNFCASPWFHMRITNSGGMTYCRWANKNQTQAHIKNVDPAVFFQQHMQGTRNELLQGQRPSGCQACHDMEKHGKISGRQKQLLKAGVRLEQFEKTIISSPWLQTFSSQQCTQLPQDWHIDLGNYCNSACVFCGPGSSSKLATEWLKIGLIDSLPPNNWSDDPQLLQRVIDTLLQCKHIQYVHFIGGETLITPAFKIILQALIEAGLNKSATVGFTTNLSVWRSDIVELLEQFKSVNLGMSVESFDAVNDYVRWPVTLSTVMQNIAQWQQVAAKNSWLLQFRITPTCLTVGKMLPIYDYAWQHKITVESCDFLQHPKIMKPSVLPMTYRQPIIHQMQQWIDQHQVQSETVVNIRNPNTVSAQLIQDLGSYVAYLSQESDHSELMPELVQFLQKIERSRNNSILSYLPEYEELFRSAGY